MPQAPLPTHHLTEPKRKPSPAAHKSSASRTTTSSPIKPARRRDQAFKMPVSIHHHDPRTYPSATSRHSRSRLCRPEILNRQLTLHFSSYRATRLSAPSKSLPKLSVRTAPSPSGFVCAPATPSGKLRPHPASRKTPREAKRTEGGRNRPRHPHTNHTLSPTEISHRRK
jgi:hypothetical protein